MKLFHKALCFVSALALFAAASIVISTPKAAEVSADKTQVATRAATSGTMLYVNGQSTYFNTGEADLAIYCMTSSGQGAWSSRMSYRLYGDLIPVPLPKLNGSSTTWHRFRIARYNPSLDPQVNGFDGAYNLTSEILFSTFQYYHNTVTITGYDGGALTYASMYASNYQYGITAENHMYLDLSDFPQWEEGGAKFAIYFGFPQSGDATAWSTSYTQDKTYVPSFCWKVGGQDNDHLYECVVPNIYGGNNRNLWSMAIAVRLDPAATTPNWDQKWNQTQNLGFNALNENANVIHIEDWNRGEFEEATITQAQRVGFYGNYFLDTVTCSGTGAYDATTDSMWGSVQAEYDRLSRFVQGDIWTAKADQEGSAIEQAMARYDEIVFTKGYNHADFINREESPSRTATLGYYVRLNGLRNEHWAILAILGISVLTGAGLFAFHAFRKKKAR